MKRVADDDRIDPRIRLAFGPDEMLGKVEHAIQAASSSSDARAFANRDEYLESRYAEASQTMALLMGAKPTPRSAVLTAAIAGLWSKDGLIDKTLEVTSRPHWNRVKINFVRPATASTDLPCVVYFHGGGMASGSAFDPQYLAWANMISRQGIAVAFIDFRNCELPSASNQDVAPFPAGLDDCYSGLVEVHRR
eukprot:g5510.t1